MKNIWISEKKPLLVLAPMAGYTDSAFRVLCKEYGADIVMTELISADAIAHGKFKVTHQCHPRPDRGSTIVDPRLRGDDRRESGDDKEEKEYQKTIVEGKNHSTAELLSFDNRERPLVVQLFGKYPEKFAKATKWITEELKPDGIDINMGCPARKVVGSDHGAALLKNCGLAVEILKAVKENTNLPVSVKTRLGWESDDEILDFAPKLIEAGVDALIIHGRTYKDGFKNISRWENIFKIKDLILNMKSKISIIGNGDIKSYDEAVEKSKLGDIQLDGVAIGRAAFGKPTIFQETRDKKQETNIKELIQRHAELVFETKGERGIIEFRKHLLAYLKGFPKAKELRLEAVKIESLEDVINIVNNIQ